MNATNRFGNRVLLMLIGLVSIASGAWLALRAYPEVLAGLTLPEIPAELDPTTLWILVGAAALAIILSIGWIVTRGGGRTSEMVVDTSDDGSLELDVKVAGDLVSAALQRQPDVLSVKASAYRVRRTPTLQLTVSARSGCDLPRLREDVAMAVEQLDRVIERRIPVLLHVTSGVRASFAREQRVT